MSSTPKNNTPLRTVTQSPIRRYRLHNLIDEPSTNEKSGHSSVIGNQPSEQSKGHYEDKVKDMLYDEPIMPLNNMTHKLHQQRRVPPQEGHKNGDAGMKEPIYYKPPSASSRNGFKALLPPGAGSVVKNRNPIIVQETEHPQPRLDDELSDEEDDSLKYPTGEWVNPVVKTALSRQVNKQQQFYKLAYIILVEMNQDPNVRSINQYLKQGLDDEKNGLNYYGSIIIKCYDLPLTNKQRELVGLKPMEEEVKEDFEDEDVVKDDLDSNLILKQRKFDAKLTKNEIKEIPKYNRSNLSYSMYTIQPKQTDSSDNLQTRLTEGDFDYNLAKKKLIQSGDHQVQLANQDINSKEQTELIQKFKEKYNLDFNYDTSVDTRNVLSSLK
ncbi:hypothetical protein QCA50_017042 [Cerrena zonata]|uniref:Uncharacterized protein n=1 Tax=Cerrena zonata TaxID=2478898 RepID=A0AAW0FE23_9APHY